MNTIIKYSNKIMLALGAVICFAFLGRDLDLLSFGDQEAQSMGVSVKRTRTTAVIATSLLVAASVSVSGIIGIGPDVRRQDYTCGFCNMKNCFKRNK